MKRLGRCLIPIKECGALAPLIRIDVFRVPRVKDAVTVADLTKLGERGRANN